MNEIQLNIPVADMADIEALDLRELIAANQLIAEIKGDADKESQFKALRRQYKLADRKKAKAVSGIRMASRDAILTLPFTYNSADYFRVFIDTEKGKNGIQKIIDNIKEIYPGVLVEDVYGPSPTDPNSEQLRLGVRMKRRLIKAGETVTKSATKTVVVEPQYKRIYIDNTFFPSETVGEDPAKRVDDVEQPIYNDDGDETGTETKQEPVEMPRLFGQPERRTNV